MKYIKKLTSKGFSHVEALVVVLTLVIIGGAYALISASHADVVPATGGAATYHWTSVSTYVTDKPTVAISACQSTNKNDKIVVTGMAVMSKAVSAISPYKTTWVNGKPTNNSYSFFEFDYSSPQLSNSTFISQKGTGEWGHFAKPLSARVAFAFKSEKDTAVFAVSYPGQSTVGPKTIAVSSLKQCY